MNVALVLYEIKMKKSTKGGYEFGVSESKEKVGYNKLVAHTSELNSFAMGEDIKPVVVGYLYKGVTSMTKEV